MGRLMRGHGEHGGRSRLPEEAKWLQTQTKHPPSWVQWSAAAEVTRHLRLVICDSWLWFVTVIRDCDSWLLFMSCDLFQWPRPLIRAYLPGIQYPYRICMLLSPVAVIDVMAKTLTPGRTQIPGSETDTSVGVQKGIGLPTQMHSDRRRYCGFIAYSL